LKTKRPATRAATAYRLLVLVPVLTGLVLKGIRSPGTFIHPHPGSLWDVLFWTLVVAVVELIPVPVSSVLTFSVSFPVMLAVALIYNSPFLVAAIIFVGAFDPKEIRGELPLLTGFFNRSQLAVSFAAGSMAFHSVAGLSSPFRILIPAALLCATLTYVANVVFIGTWVCVSRKERIRDVLAQLRVGGPREYFISYVGLAFVGLVIVRLYLAVDLWAVAVFILPLIFARQMFFRTLALEEASKELKDREQVLRALSNRMAEERQDERMQIAGYLHDDLAQMLFRLTLQAEMAKKRLAKGDTRAVSKDLDGILATKQETSDAIRALIRDLHRSPMGRKGLHDAIRSFADDISRGHATTISTDIVEVALPPPIQLLIYQIAREAAMNALKHADAATIAISLNETENGVELRIRDDGKGFDTSAPPPEGHFGSVMMRERALVAGGKYSIESEPGQGTSISAQFPRVWVEEGTALEAASTAATAPGNGGSKTSSGPPSKTKDESPTVEPPTAPPQQPQGEAVPDGLEHPAARAIPA
jgi:signal transduction histidine kinase